VYQRPHPPIWRSVVAPTSFTECGRLGVPILTTRFPLARLRERLERYEAGLVDGGHPAPTRERLLRDVAVWRHVYVGESQGEAEDTLAATVLHTRQHMLRLRAMHNPRDFQVDPTYLNPFMDARVPDEEAVRHSLATGTLYGTGKRVAEQVDELRALGVHHVLCQMSFGYLAHEKIMASMRRFGEHVRPAFRG
jgi:alkanesulfonate monooxygenase SsuD/methylene tetrahydromethanopterin reductase-like flavin-dependent oxidoreductase (luciferase family)